MQRRLDSLSIRSRLLLLALAILVPAITLVAWLLAGEYGHVERLARARVDLLAAGTVDDLQHLLDGNRRELEALAGRLTERSQTGPGCAAVLAEPVNTQPSRAVLSVSDARGTLLCVTPDMAPVRAAAEAVVPPYAAALGGFTVGRLVHVAQTDQWLVPLHQPVRDARGTTVGVLSASLDLRRLSDELLGGVPANALVSVTDASRTILLRSSQARRFIGSVPAEGQPNPAAETADGFGVARGRDGIVRLYVLKPLASANWRVAAGLPESDASGEARQALALTAAAIVLVLVAAAVMAWRLSRTITRPIHHLMGTAVRVAGGDVAARAELQGPPELQAVARQFNTMLDARAVAEGRLRAIVESAVDAILTADASQTIVQANPAAAAMFRTTLADMIGSPLERYIPPARRSRHREDVAAFGAGSVEARHMGAAREVMALRADGSEMSIEASISRVNVNGQRFFTVIHRDISERKRVEADLLEGRAKLAAALASMNDAVFIADAEGHIQEFNEAFARFLRFDDKASCPRTFADAEALIELRFDDGRTAPPALWATARALRGESASGVEYRLRRLDTGESWIGSYSFAPIRGADGAIAGAVVVARDVTAARLAQADLAASHAALQRLIAAQDRVQEDERARIARELHDDLQQTLAAIRIDLGDLAERLGSTQAAPGDLVREVDTLAERAIQSTRRIVDDLRPQMIEELGLAPALEHLAARFERHNGITCSVDTTGEASFALDRESAAATCLYRVAQEALNNVAKHAGAHHVAIRLSVSDGVVDLRIEDDGRGIRAVDRLKLESFGVLGMQERVRAQGGLLDVKSGEGGGTIVAVLLPLPDQDLASRQPAAVGSGPVAPGYSGSVPETRLLSQTAQNTLQSAIDAMACSVAVIDGTGTLRLVNRAWIDFAEGNGNPALNGCGPGASYLDVCRRAARTDPQAAAVLKALGDLLAGRSRDFTHEYVCHAPHERRWFRMHATAMTSGDVLVMHVPLGSAEVPSEGTAVDDPQRTRIPS